MPGCQPRAVVVLRERPATLHAWKRLRSGSPWRATRRGAGRKGSSKTNYNGTISLKGISDTETLTLAETGEAESYRAIYHSAFAFAHIFSNLLDIEVEFIDKT